MMPQARKRFGQHFLTSSDTIEQIVSAIMPQAGETIARSIARAVVRFFERYPPGSGTGGPGDGV